MKRRNHFRERAKRQRRALYVFVLAITIIFGCLTLFAIADDGIDSITITVDSGDTFWSICKPYAPDDMDFRDFMAKVKYMNGIRNSSLSIGQELKIPIK